MYHQTAGVRVPIHQVERLGKLRRIARLLEEKSGREATEEDVVEYLAENSKDPSVLEATRHHVRKIQLDGELRPIFLDATNEEGEVVFHEMIGSGGALPETVTMARRELLYVAVFTEEYLAFVRSHFGDRGARNAAIISMRLGLSGEDEESSLEHSGKTSGLTRERVRQILNVSIKLFARKKRMPARKVEEILRRKRLLEDYARRFVSP